MPGQLPPTSQPRLERLKLNMTGPDGGGGRTYERAGPTLCLSRPARHARCRERPRL